jgi:hypothetical protein
MGEPCLQPSTGSGCEREIRAVAYDGEEAGEVSRTAGSASVAAPTAQERAPLPRRESAEEAVGAEDASPLRARETLEGAVALPQAPAQSAGESPPGLKTFEELFPSRGGEPEPAVGGAEKRPPARGGEMPPARSERPEHTPRRGMESTPAERRMPAPRVGGCRRGKEKESRGEEEEGERRSDPPAGPCGIQRGADRRTSGRFTSVALHGRASGRSAGAGRIRARTAR